jgi:hypothetical protein
MMWCWSMRAVIEFETEAAYDQQIQKLEGV